MLAFFWQPTSDSWDSIHANSAAPVFCKLSPPNVSRQERDAIAVVFLTLIDKNSSTYRDMRNKQ